MPDVTLSTGVDQSGVATGMAAIRTEVARSGVAIQKDLAAAFSLSGLAAGTISIAAIKNLTEYGSQIQSLGERFKVDTGILQQFANAAEKSDVSIESVAASFNRLDVSRAQALSGNKELLASFARLNVTEEDLRNLSIDQIMLKLGTSSLNAADAVKILGRNGTELRATLQGLADGTIQLGQAMDPGLIARLNKANETLTSMGQRAKILASELLEPIFGPIIEGASKLFEALQHPLGHTFVDDFVEKLKEDGAWMIHQAQTIGAAILASLKGDFSKWSEAGKVFWEEGIVGKGAEGGLSKLDQQIANVKQQLAELEGQPPVIVNVDSTEVEELGKQIDAVKGPTTAQVATSADTSQLDTIPPKLDAIKGPTVAKVMSEADAAQVEALQKQIDAIKGPTTAKVLTEADTSTIRELEAEIARVRAPVTVRVLTEVEIDKLHEAQAELDRLKTPAIAHVTSEVDDARIHELEELIERIKGPATARVLSVADSEQVVELQKQLDAVKGPTTARVYTEAETSRIEELQSQIEAIKGPATARVLTEADTFKVDALQAQIDAIKGPTVAQVTSEADATRVQELQAQIDLIRGPTIAVVDANTAPARARIEELKKELAALEERKSLGVGGGESDDFGRIIANADQAAKKAEQTQAAIAKLEEDHAARQRSNQEQLNTLIARSSELYYAQAAAAGDTNKQLEARKAYLENEKAIDEVTAKMDQEATRLAKEKSDAIAKNVELAQNEQATAAQSLADSKEAAKEDQLRLKGREDLAEQAKLIYEFDSKIAQAERDAADAAEEAKNAKTEGEREALQAVVATNAALAQQLGLEKNVALAALQKAQAERAAAEAAKVGAAAQQAAEDLDATKEKTAALKEQRAEQEQIAAGHADVAAKMHDEFETAQQIEAIQEDITTATDEANDAWDNAAKAWSEGKNALAAQYTQLAKNKSAIADELSLQKQLTAETRATAAAEKAAADNAKTWAEGMQNFANNAQSLLQNVQNYLQNTPEGQAFQRQYGGGAEQLLVNPNVPSVQRAMLEAGGGAIDPARLNQLQAQQALIALQGGDINKMLGVNQSTLMNYVNAQVKAALDASSKARADEISNLQNIAAGILVYSSKLGQYVNPQQLADVERRGSLAQTPPNERGLFLALQEANKKDAIAALEAKIAAAQQAAAAASAAGNVAEEQKQITLQAQLQTQLDQARTGLSASQQAQRAQDTINERKAIELDYQNKINAATAAHNDALVAQLSAEEKVALAIFDKAHPPGAAGPGATPIDQAAIDSVEKQIAASKEAAAEMEQVRAGHQAEADQMRIRFDFEQRIADATKAASEARASGQTALADANDALAKQLAVEEQISLEQAKQLIQQQERTDAAATYNEDQIREIHSRLALYASMHKAESETETTKETTRRTVPLGTPPPAAASLLPAVAPLAAALIRPTVAPVALHSAFDVKQFGQLTAALAGMSQQLVLANRKLAQLQRNTYVPPGSGF